MCYTTHTNYRRVVCKEKNRDLKMELCIGNALSVSGGYERVNFTKIGEHQIILKHNVKNVICKPQSEHGIMRIQKELIANICVEHGKAIHLNSERGNVLPHSNDQKMKKLKLAQHLIPPSNQAKLLSQQIVLSAVNYEKLRLIILIIPNRWRLNGFAMNVMGINNLGYG